MQIISSYQKSFLPFLLLISRVCIHLIIELFTYCISLFVTEVSFLLHSSSFICSPFLVALLRILMVMRGRECVFIVHWALKLTGSARIPFAYNIFSIITIYFFTTIIANIFVVITRPTSFFTAKPNPLTTTNWFVVR